VIAEIARGFASVVALLPVRRHEHVWDLDRCDVGNCSVCGLSVPQFEARNRTWHDRLGDWIDAMRDCFDIGD
jgi:hypothetical protein